MISTAIILAGGLGTRLRSEVPDLPKCMAPVNGQPFLAFVIGYLQKEGIKHFVFSLGYKSDVVIEYINHNYPQLHKTFVVEDEPLGTGGALQLAVSGLQDKHVVIVNGDTLFNVDLKYLCEKHLDLKADCTIALKHLKEFSRYGTVELNEDSTIRAFKEKKYCTEGFINGGVYVLNIHQFLLKAIKPSFSFEKEFLEKYTGILKFYGIKNDHFFIDIGVPEDYKLFQSYSNLILSKQKYDADAPPAASGHFDIVDAVIEMIDKIFDDL
jgi:D-glycero-alpha-D-manno-heptose 1-phosphate guanylyltransferase